LVRQHAQVQINPEIQGHQVNSSRGCHRIHRLDNDIDSLCSGDVFFAPQTRQSRSPQKMSGGVLLQVNWREIVSCIILAILTKCQGNK